MGENNTEPLLILHGLYGSSDNWLNIGKQLAEYYRVFLIDQRNHGNSPHSDKHNYHLMRDDLYEFMKSHELQKTSIIGHSMGGKVAIYFALEYPELIDKLIVVDIGPGAYQSLTNPTIKTLNHLNILNALYNLDIGNISTISEADNELSETIPYKRVRQFLLKNLKRDGEGNFYWILNIKTLRNELPSIMDGIDINNYSGEAIQDYSFSVLFLRGGNSEYVKEKEIKDIQILFPDAQIQTIKNAGHWVHAEKRERFLETVTNFLKNN
jgi:pimeloyl-ACP methyl ester carboxylesterase